MSEVAQLVGATHDRLGAATAGEHDAILAAMHRLERALAAAAPGREPVWARRVAVELRAVRAELEQHRRSAEGPDGLFDEILRVAPWMMYRLERLRAAHDAAVDEVDGLLSSVGRVAEGNGGAFDAIRRRTAALLTGLRAHQAEETDLIFETFDRDIGAVD